MTSMPHVVAVAGSTDDAAAELANLRAAYESACNELIEVRRQRDEAVRHGEELLARLVEADEKVARLSTPHPPVFETEPIRVAPVQPEPDPVSPIPTIVGAPPVEPPVLAEVADVGEVADADEASVAAQPLRWLPPEEGAVAHSTAHEFAALKELPDDVAEDDEQGASLEPLTSPMNVLPEGTTAVKQSIWRRKIL